MFSFLFYPPAPLIIRVIFLPSCYLSEKNELTAKLTASLGEEALQRRGRGNGQVDTCRWTRRDEGKCVCVRARVCVTGDWCLQQKDDNLLNLFFPPVICAICSGGFFFVRGGGMGVHDSHRLVARFWLVAFIMWWMYLFISSALSRSKAQLQH